jgi:DNA-directed RNA polymerase subunit RPC12/RpoP
MSADQFDQFRETLGADRVDTFLAKFGLGPKYQPTPPKTYECPKCKKQNAAVKERHPDTDMNHMALVCPDCGYEEER